MNKCVMCGADIDEKSGKYYCETCEEKMRYVKKLSMVDKAEKLILKKSRDKKEIPDEEVLKYSKVVRERISNGIDKFSSVPEVIAAIQMQRINLEYETQKMIAGTKVDFYIPEIKIIFEVDGSIYHSDKDKTFLRDRQIMKEVGEKWEIVHINSDKIPKYTWNLRDTLPFVVLQRNDKWRFRDSEFDSDFLMDFDSLEKYLRRQKRNENTGLLKANRAT